MDVDPRIQLDEEDIADDDPRIQFDEEAIADYIASEKTHPSLASESEFLAAKQLPFPRYLPMQHTYEEDSFFVRPCYAQYYAFLIETKKKDRVIRGVTITGTPGIGKSMFMAYFFLRFRLENPTRTIMMQAYDRQSRLMKVTVWGREGLCAYIPADSEAAGRIVAKYTYAAAICLVDGPPPHPFDNRFYLCFTSPNEDWYRTSVKSRNITEIFMPVWDEDELRTAARVLGLDALLEPLEPADALELGISGDAAVDVLEARVHTFGGVAGPCLEVDRRFWLKSLKGLQDAIETIKAYTNLDSTPPSHEACHRLFHYILSDPSDCTQVFVNVASPYVRKLALAHILQLETKKQMIVEKLLLLNAVTMGVAGFVVEKRVHVMLLEGVTFAARLLHNDRAGGAHVSKTFVVRKSDSADGVPTNFERSSLSGGPYYIPISQNMTSIDSFYYQHPPAAGPGNTDALDQPRVILFQVTVSKVHPIKSEGVVDVLTRLQLLGTSAAASVAFVFVVPRKHADTFKRQQIQAIPSLSPATGVRVVKGIASAIAKDLEFFHIHTVGELESTVVDPQGASPTQFANLKRARAALARHRQREASAGESVLPRLEAIPQYVWGV